MGRLSRFLFLNAMLWSSQAQAADVPEVSAGPATGTVPAATLMVTVRHGHSDQVAAITGRSGRQDVLPSGSGDSIVRRTGERDVRQASVSVTEGEWAFVRTEESIPFLVPGVTVTPWGPTVAPVLTDHRLVSGFAVRVLELGDGRVQVQLRVVDQREDLSLGWGGVRGQSMAAVVRGKMGEWIPVAEPTAADVTGRGRFAGTRNRGRQDVTVHVRVDPGD